MPRCPRLLCVLAAIVAALSLSVPAVAGTDDVLLPVPQRSQFDGSIWAASDCGPASLAMVLEAFGDKVSTVDLRKRANQLLGVSSPDTGTKIEHLARIAQEHGFSVVDPMEGKSYRRWTVEQVRAEIRAGHPAVIQVYFPLLPNQRRNPVVTDHFVVLVGSEGADFIYNDPADSQGPGYRQRMTEAQLSKAWGWSSAPFAAFSVAPGSAGKSLLPPPEPTPTATEAPASRQQLQMQIDQLPLIATPTVEEPIPTATPTPEQVSAVATPSAVQPSGGELAIPENSSRQATGSEELRPSSNHMDQLASMLPSPIFIALLVIAMEVRTTWWRRTGSRSTSRR